MAINDDQPVAAASNDVAVAALAGAYVLFFYSSKLCCFVVTTYKVLLPSLTLHMPYRSSITTQPPQHWLGPDRLQRSPGLVLASVVSKGLPARRFQGL